MTKLMAVSRKLVAGDHQSLRENIPSINHKLNDLQPKWRRLGEAGISLLDRGEYDTATQAKGSKLALANPETLANTLNTHIIPKMPTESDSLTIDIMGVDFLGRGKYLSIAFLLDLDPLGSERGHFTGLIDQMNGVNMDWRNFIPHVSIATIDRANAEPRVLDAFGAIAPGSVKFDAAKAFAT